MDSKFKMYVKQLILDYIMGLYKIPDIANSYDIDIKFASDTSNVTIYLTEKKNG